MNTIMQLRKICNHPYMFQQIEVRLKSVTHGDTLKCSTVCDTYLIAVAGILL